jgi:hypothetical protein
MSIRIVYTINDGTLPIIVQVMDGITEVDSNSHVVYGTYEFNDVPDGEYTLLFTDADSCTYSSAIALCTDCPEGYESVGDKCVEYDVVDVTYTSSVYTVVKKSSDVAYSVYGLLIFDSWNYNGTGSFEWVNDSNTYWRNVPYPTNVGVMNRSAVWGSTTSNNQDIGFSFCISIAISKIYYIGVGCDNYSIIKLNGVSIIEQDVTALKSMFPPLGMSGGTDDGVTFKYWYVYPIELSVGQNVIEIFGHNVTLVAGVGIEIYDATKQELINATSDTDLGSTTRIDTDTKGKILFRSSDLVGETLQYEYSTGGGYHGYSCPEGYALDTCGETVRCVKKDILDCGETPTTTTTTI